MRPIWQRGKNLRQLSKPGNCRHAAGQAQKKREGLLALPSFAGLTQFLDRALAAASLACGVNCPVKAVGRIKHWCVPAVSRSTARTAAKCQVLTPPENSAALELATGTSRFSPPLPLELGMCAVVIWSDLTVPSNGRPGNSNRLLRLIREAAEAQWTGTPAALLMEGKSGSGHHVSTRHTRIQCRHGSMHETVSVASIVHALE